MYVSWWKLREGILQWRDTGCSDKTGILTNVPGNGRIFILPLSPDGEDDEEMKTKRKKRISAYLTKESDFTKRIFK